MAINSKLDSYWDEFVDNFISTLLADGYDEFEILDKIMTVFKNVRMKKVSSPISSVTVLKEEPIVTVTPTEDTSIKEVKVGNTVMHVQEIDLNNSDEKKIRKYPEHKKPISREKNPCNYDKTLHSKFHHAVVYVKGAKDESLATIEVGDSQKSRDCYKLISNGRRYSEVDYLKTFNHNVNLTPGGYSFLNRHVIVFDVNPTISVGYVKNLKHYNQFKNIDDVKNWKKSTGGRGNKRNDI